jgi:hypothetical protein
MSQINYSEMSDRELKRYFLTHRNDKVAFQIYLGRRRKKLHQIVTKVGDIDFDLKIKAAIRQKIANFKGATE